ncbi:hypothetical protein K2X33_13760 [bacterium]|nr:hypothetical protein [bacterium]
MDHRFPKYLRFLVGKLDFISLPNLGMLISGLAVLGFVGQHVLNAPLDRFLFDPVAFMDGEYWRVFAFPVTSGPILLLFFVLYAYFIFGQLESSWGEAPTTIFTILSYLAAMGASFYAGVPLPIWQHVLTNVSLAFGSLFPDQELYFFGILPVKAKWLAALAGALLAYQFFTSNMYVKIYLVIMLSPYFVFFGPMLYKAAKMRLSVNRNRRRWGGD